MQAINLQPKEAKESPKSALRQYIIEVLKVIPLALAIVLPVRYFLIQPFKVVGASMQPNFYNQDYLIIDELHYRFEDPQRGEIIVFHPPNNPSQDYIKRVIGLPGETVIVSQGVVTIQNSAHPQGFVLDESSYIAGVYTPGETHVTLKANEYFVMGDNRSVSLDSRSFGPMPRANLVGRVWIRGWPIEKSGSIQAAFYPKL